MIYERIFVDVFARHSDAVWKSWMTVIVQDIHDPSFVGSGGTDFCTSSYPTRVAVFCEVDMFLILRNAECISAVPSPKRRKENYHGRVPY